MKKTETFKSYLIKCNRINIVAFAISLIALFFLVQEVIKTGDWLILVLVFILFCSVTTFGYYGGLTSALDQLIRYGTIKLEDLLPKYRK